MIFQELVDMTAIMTPVLSIVILIFLLVLMIYFYGKKKIFLPILTIYLFSMIMGLMALRIDNFPFTPYLQTFFIVIQTVFLLLTAIEVFHKS